MGFKSLKSRLLLAVSTLVICSGLLISLLVTQRYSSSLRESMAAQGENLAQAVALEATDRILINDLVGLQRMLDHQKRSHPSISYLFISRDGRVLAHTFQKGIPTDLPGANDLTLENQVHFQKISSLSGETYLDIALPIFEGKAGVLRLGLSESLYWDQMNRLWLQMGIFTLVILLLALCGTLLFVRRITRPLSALAEATKKIDKGSQGVRVQVQGDDEVGQLAGSFNHMVARMEEYTRKLEEQTMELERAHDQTRTFCGIVQEIGSLPSLSDIGSFLLNRFENIFKCGHMVLLVFNDDRDLLFSMSKTAAEAFKKTEYLQAANARLRGIRKVSFSRKMLFTPPWSQRIFKGRGARPSFLFNMRISPLERWLLPVREGANVILKRSTVRD